VGGGMGRTNFSKIEGLGADGVNQGDINKVPDRPADRTTTVKNKQEYKQTLSYPLAIDASPRLQDRFQCDSSQTLSLLLVHPNVDFLPRLSFPQHPA